MSPEERRSTGLNDSFNGPKTRVPKCCKATILISRSDVHALPSVDSYCSFAIGLARLGQDTPGERVRQPVAMLRITKRNKKCAAQG